SRRSADRRPRAVGHVRRLPDQGRAHPVKPDGPSIAPARSQGGRSDAANRRVAPWQRCSRDAGPAHPARRTGMTTTSDRKMNLNKSLEQLQTLRDEVRVKLHLAGLDAK